MRVLLGMVLGIAVMAVPIERAAACDCALIEMPEAVREADVAFVGTLEEQLPGGDNFGFPTLDEWHWSVERSRDVEIGARLVLNATVNDGANCGVAFAMGERWLVIASVHEGVLQTNGCQPNHRMDGSAPDTEALISELLPHEAATAEAAAFSMLLPLVVVIGAVVIVGGIGLLAFRREGSR